MTRSSTSDDRIGADLLLDHEPATALVDLAFVVTQPFCGKYEELIRVFAVREAAQIGVARSVLQRRRVHAVVVARVELPDVAVCAEEVRP